MGKSKKGKRIPSLDEVNAAINEFEAQNHNNKRSYNRRPTHKYEGWTKVGKYDYSHNGHNFTGKCRAAR